MMDAAQDPAAREHVTGYFKLHPDFVKIVRAGYPDHTAWDPASEHFDPRSSPANPVWYMVDVRLEREFKHPVTLAALRHNPALRGMKLLERGSRLSVLPVTVKEWTTILKMEKSD